MSSAATTEGGSDDSTDAQVDSRGRVQARVEVVGVADPSAAQERLSSALTSDDLARLRRENECDLERARAAVARLEVEQEQIVYAIVSKRSHRE